MDLSKDALELVCSHLDVRSIVQLAGTDSVTRSKLSKCTIRVKEPVPLVPMPTPMLQRFFYHWRFVPTCCPILCLAWCPKSTRVACSREMHCVFICDPDSALEPICLYGHPRVQCIAWSPDGSELVTASPDGIMRIYDTETGLTKREIQFDCEFPRSVTWCTEGIQLITGSWLLQLRTWKADGSGIVQSREFRTLYAEWSADGTKYVSTAFNNSVFIWDALTGEELHGLPGHTNVIDHFAWSPDSTKIVSGSRDHTARVWDAITGRLIHVFHLGNRVTSVGWNANGTKLVTGSADGTVRIWDAATGNELHVLRNDDGVKIVAWSADEKKIIYSTYRAIYIWNL